MLAGRLGMGRVAADIQAVDTVVVRCGRLPLALAVAAARAATQPELSIAVLAHQSRDAGHGLDAFASGDASTDVRAVFSWSYRKLTPEAARVFRLLGIHPGTGIGAAAAAALAGTTAGSVTVALTELTTAHLVAWNPTGTGVTASGRYSLHDLLRLYAAELADAVDSESEQRAALSRVFDYLSLIHISEPTRPY